MKFFTYRSIIRRFLHIVLMLCASVTIHAYDFKVDGVCYNILSDTEHTVEVTYEAVNSPYVGDIVIPVSVMNNGVSYKVVQIGDFSMVDIIEITDYSPRWFGNTLLKSVTIQANIESIGDFAFDGCSSLKTLSLPAIRRIGNSAFSRCSGLTAITIPNSVTTIGHSAFADCSGLTAITIPNSVTTIGYSAFADCSGLTSIVVDAANTKYDSRDNCNAIIETSTNKIIVGCKNTVIPNSVTMIESSAFKGCSGLTSITIPNSVTTIESPAFAGCNDLVSIVVDAANTKYDSRDNCNAIIETSTDKIIVGCKNTVIPNSVTTIGFSSFFRCSGLTAITIPNSVTTIETNAFHECRRLTSITVPNSVTGIGSNAFDGTAWYNDQPDGLVYAGKVAYKYKGTIPSNTGIVLREGTLGIAESAFSGCTGLTSITIPNSVTSIWKWAFDGTAWYNNQPDGLVYAGKVAYKYKGTMPSNTDIVLREGTLGITESAFSGCTGLASITIPNSVTSIGSDAFFDCSNLESVTIHNGVTSIGFDAFRNCNNLTKVKVEWPFPISIQSTTFSNSNNATLYVPQGSKATYQSCAYWQDFKEIVEVIPLKDGDTFTAKTIEGIDMTFKVISADAKTCQVGNGSSSAINTSSSGNVTIPSTTNGFTVTSIGRSAFDDCRELNSIIISETISNIGSIAFNHCINLTSITVDNSNAHYDSRDNCNAIIETATNKLLYGCKNTTIPSNVISIGSYAFENINTLSSIIIPNSIKTIGNFAFDGCGLTSITIPNSVTSIYDGVFGYSNLNSIYVEQGNTHYDSRNNCNAIIETATNKLISGCKNTTIPNNVSSIGAYAFFGCRGLTSLTIPNSVASIGNAAFWECSGLTSMKVEWDKPIEISSNAFSDKTNTTLYVPKGSKTAYQSSSYWKDFKEIVEYEDESTISYELSISSNGNGSVSYSGNTFSNATWSYTVNEGSSATLTFTPNSGYRIGSLKVNNVDVTSSVSNNKYTISSITRNTTVEVTFEAIPPTTYILTIITNRDGHIDYFYTTNPSPGSDHREYNGTVTSNYSMEVVKEGAVTLTLYPNNGCELSKLEVNGTDVTSIVSNSQYTIAPITTNLEIIATFQEIPEPKQQIDGHDYVDLGLPSGKLWATMNYGASKPEEYGSYLNWSSTDIISSLWSSAWITPTLTDIRELESNCTWIWGQINGVNGYKINGKNGNSIFIPAAGVKVGNLSHVGEWIYYWTSTIDTDYDNMAHILLATASDVAWGSLNSTFTQIPIRPVSKEGKVVPPTTFTLSITSYGSGSVTYSGNTFNSTTRTYTVSEGTTATLTFTPNSGYQIGSLKVNDEDVTSTNNQYIISSINKNTTISVTFEPIPPTTYTLSITSSGNGSVSYSGNTFSSTTRNYNVNGGTSATLTLAPSSGYMIGSLKVNNVDVTMGISNNKYTISNIYSNTSVSVTFVAIPPTTYTLSITSSGYGLVKYSGNTISSGSKQFTINEGSSATLTFTLYSGYRIGSLIVNNVDVTSSISNNQYTISSISRNTTVSVTFEAIPPATYTLSITSSGSGYVTYSGSAFSNKTNTYTINEGSSATLTFTLYSGYRIGSLKVNNVDVTSSIYNNQYTISSISRNTTVSVTFEEIPPTTYTLSITSSGSGYVTYSGSAFSNKTNTYTVNEGTSATLTFTPNSGYRIGSLKVNNVDVTSSVSNNKYTISSINRNTTVSVTFEEIPPTTYTLSITSSGSGSVTYSGFTIKGTSRNYTVNEGTSATLTFAPNSGYKVGSLKVNNVDVTSSVSNNKYTISSINRNTTVSVTFEAIAPTTYTLSITSSGSGSVAYSGFTIKGTTRNYTVNQGTSATLTFTPNSGYKVGSLKVNNADVTSYINNNTYTISSITKNTTVEVTFEQINMSLTFNGVNYRITSYDNGTVNVASGSYGQSLKVPAAFYANGKTWQVKGMDSDVLTNNPQLAAVIWEPSVKFDASPNNPNFLLYVTSADYAPLTIKNVIVNGTANSITLTEATSGNDFYCPEKFTAQSISYRHNYMMTTGIGESQGWETIALPFDVQTITHTTKGVIMPFAKWSSGNSRRPFWLYELTSSGWREASSINAYTPYIISMPNNNKYYGEARLNGDVTFSATNVTVKPTDIKTASYQGKTFTPNFTTTSASASIYALNVKNQWAQNTNSQKEGSTFVQNLRTIHPFEAYMSSENSTRSSFPIFEDMTTGIRGITELIDMKRIEGVYNLKGQKIKMEADGKLPAGIYIINGQKVIVK